MDGKVIRTFILGLLIFGLATILGLFHVWKAYRCTQVGGDVARISQELSRVEAENLLLQAEFNSLSGARTARERTLSDLGMRPPSSRETIHMEPLAAGGGR